MELTKKVNLDGNHTVNVSVYRDGSEIGYKRYEYIFTHCFLPWLEERALVKCYEKAHAWADTIIAVEKSVKHS